MTALCAPGTAGRGKIRLLVSDLARAKEAFKTLSVAKPKKVQQVLGA